MGQFAKDLEARIDFFTCERAQAVGAERLDDERTHDAAVEHGAFQNFPVDLLLRSQIAHESSSEGITGAGGILHFLDWQGRSAEGMVAESESTFAKEDCRAVLSVLDNQSFRSHGHHFLRG